MSADGARIGQKHFLPVGYGKSASSGSPCNIVEESIRTPRLLELNESYVNGHRHEH